MGIFRSPLGRAGAVGVVAAIIVNLIIFGIGSLADLDWKAAYEDLNAGAVVIVSLVAGVIFTIVAIVLLRYMKIEQPTRIFVIVVSVMTLVSLVSPFGSDAETSTKLVLALMHIVVAAVMIGVLSRPMLAAERRRAEAA